jgi:hypothetical protein
MRMKLFLFILLINSTLLIQAMFDAREELMRGASLCRSIDSFNIHWCDQEADKACIICFNELKQDELLIKRMRCGHEKYLCIICFGECLRASQSCPLCRHNPVEHARDFLLALELHNNSALRVALSRGIPVDAPLNRFGCTALMSAVEQSDYEMISMLLRAGASPYVKDFFGVTPYSIACENKKIAIIGMLLLASWYNFLGL